MANYSLLSIRLFFNSSSRRNARGSQIRRDRGMRCARKLADALVLLRQTCESMRAPPCVPSSWGTMAVERRRSAQGPPTRRWRLFRVPRWVPEEGKKAWATPCVRGTVQSQTLSDPQTIIFTHTRAEKNLKKLRLSGRGRVTPHIGSTTSGS
jgi:hypothetical protein